MGTMDGRGALAMGTTFRSPSLTGPACPAPPQRRGLSRDPLSRGMLHLSKEGRRRREVRESAQTPLLLQQEAAGVLLGIALGAEAIARVSHLAPKARDAANRASAGSEAALLGSVPAKPAVPLLVGDDECSPHVHLF